jgi:hypothetical protein
MNFYLLLRLQLFSIVLRVELVSSELVAYIRDTSDTITRAEFDEAIVTKVFPRCIKTKVNEFTLSTHFH